MAQALLDVMGPTGTLMVPTHVPEQSDPANWQHPPVPPSWWQPIREHTPAFDPTSTPSQGMGALAEVVRTLPGARRSAHPQVSFAAVGVHAEELTSGHGLDDGLGEGSPLATLESLGGRVLLLGVGYKAATVLHLAEYRVADPPRRSDAAAVTVDGTRRWMTFDDVDVDEEDFEAIGSALEATGAVLTGRVGGAECRLFDAREALSFTLAWLPSGRTS